MLIHILPSGLLLSLSAAELSAEQLTPEHLTPAQTLSLLRTVLAQERLPRSEIACLESFPDANGILLFVRFSKQAMCFHTASVFS